MSKYLCNAQMLGNRLTGYMVFDSEKKEFYGYTEKEIINTIKSGGHVYGFTLDESGELELDKKFGTSNLIEHRGINTLKPWIEVGIGNVMYVVYAVQKVKGGEDIYKTINSRYGQHDMQESKIKMLLEFGCIQGGVTSAKGNKLTTCEGVEIIDESQADQK